MNPIARPDFLLDTPLAQRLYHEVAAQQPVIDYHNHLDPAKIAGNHQFRSLTEAWLDGDHYKWRAMRIHGVKEHFCSGAAGDWEKMEAWAGTVPFTFRNPLFHWTHLELKKPFGISELLNPASARGIYEQCNEFLGSEPGRVRALLESWKVTWLGTTDDPCDDLRHHLAMQDEGGPLRMVPSFRPDAALQVTDLAATNAYLDRLGEVTGSEMEHYLDLLNALEERADYFQAAGCRMSDHGLTHVPYAQISDEGANAIFHKIRLRIPLTREETDQYQATLLFHLGEIYARKGWIMQLHLGAMRNNSSLAMASMGKDTGWDAIGDYPQARGLAHLLDRLQLNHSLPKTILYNLNPADNHVFASLAGTFCDGEVAGKVQWGASWWFLDQKNGIEEHLEVLSSLGLVAHFIGMLTDSRSFLSFSRHEYFRRILCRKLGQDVAAGLIPHDEAWLGELVKRICHDNLKTYLSV